MFLSQSSSLMAPSVAPVPERTESLDFEDWQRSASHVFVPLCVTPTDRSDFRGRLSGISSADTTVVRLEARPHVVERTMENIRTGGAGYFKFALQLEGSGLLVQDGRETTLAPGDLTVYDTSRPYTLSYADQASMLVLMIPHERLGGVAPDVADLVATRLGAGGLEDVVVPVLNGIASRIALSETGPGQRLIHHAVDLVETLCRDDTERVLGGLQAPNAVGGGTMAAGRQRELRRVLRYVDERLADPGLTPQSVADAHFMSVRSLYKLFDDSGFTVAAWIRSRRLERAREALLNPAQSDMSVGQVAAACGLPDPAHFSRLFRATYGMSPSEIRRTAFVDAL